jgi:hemerythrin-like domain-containing protein
MTASPAREHSGNIHDVLTDVSQALLGLLSTLQAFAQLPVLEATAAQARTIAANMLVLFRHDMFEHHAQEELQLFPAVLARAVAGEELNRARAMVRQLTADHRRIEALWMQLEPAVKAIAKERLTHVALEDVEALVQAYQAHAVFEEQQFLPLADAVLGRQRESSKVLSLHRRHGRRVDDD